MSDRPKTLQQLSSALDGEIGRFAIIDQSLYTGATPGRRSITLRRDDARGDVLGWFAEQPAADLPFVFTPSSTIAYGVLAPVVEALRSHDVRFEDPATPESMSWATGGGTDLDDLPF